MKAYGGVEDMEVGGQPRTPAILLPGNSGR